MGERLTDREVPVVLEPMHSAEAKELLKSQIHATDNLNEDDLEGLLEALEFIPLAITQAAAFINENNTSLADYLKMVRTHDSEMKDLLDEDLGDLRRDFESSSSVIKTWKCHSISSVTRSQRRHEFYRLWRCLIDKIYREAS